MPYTESYSDKSTSEQSSKNKEDHSDNSDDDESNEDMEELSQYSQNLSLNEYLKDQTSHYSANLIIQMEFCNKSTL